MLEKLLRKIVNKSIGDKIQYGLRMIFKQMLVSCIFTEFVLIFLAVMLGSLDPEVAKQLGNTQIMVFLGIFFPLFFLAGAAFIMKTVGKRVVRMVTQPLEEIEKASAELAEGKVHIEIAYTSEDEIGQVAESLRRSCNALAAYVDDISRGMNEFAEGNFAAQPSVEMKGDFETISKAMFAFEKSVADMVIGIRNVAAQVTNGANQVADSSTELAQGATEQAGVTEELTASIETATSEVSMSAEAANMVSKKVENSGITIGKSNEKVHEMVAAMNEISEASLKIQNIIDAINNIAAQTNLLALNASIEAARAGEAGRGFAVVADQIGKLAADSAQSAVETKELINKSLIEVEAGNSIVENTMESFNTVLANMESFAGMASGAAEASKEQAEMLRQIEIGIEQITEVVESNSAAAEETSAVSEELSAQATNLEQMISHFVLVEE